MRPFRALPCPALAAAHPPQPCQGRWARNARSLKAVRRVSFGAGRRLIGCARKPDVDDDDALVAAGTPPRGTRAAADLDLSPMLAATDPRCLAI